MKLIRFVSALLPLVLGSCGFYVGLAPPCPPGRPVPGTQTSGDRLDESVTKTVHQVTNPPAIRSADGATFRLDHPTTIRPLRLVSATAHVIPEEVP